MVMDQIPRKTRHGRGTPFLTDPEQYECGKCGRLGWAIIHALATGRLVRCDYWLFSLFHICRIHLINYACLNLCM